MNITRIIIFFFRIIGLDHPDTVDMKYIKIMNVRSFGTAAEDEHARFELNKIC